MKAIDIGLYAGNSFRKIATNITDEKSENIFAMTPSEINLVQKILNKTNPTYMPAQMHSF
ncbi:MAG: hypothetical protein EOO95_02295 [Pedobacter sp.]|nr:MAG: hypothetical protein EOO95_02295 [Pedobacter sp.]